jgi:hypothetical protein
MVAGATLLVVRRGAVFSDEALVDDGWRSCSLVEAAPSSELVQTAQYERCLAAKSL